MFYRQRLFILSLFLPNAIADYTAVPRWGQASAVIDDLLLIYGGMTDEYNQYSYTAAPTSSDLLALSLSSSFSTSSPPWQLLSSSTNSSTSQGPDVVWHTLSALNTSELLVFGGEPDANSSPATVTQSDSAWLLDVYNRLLPNFSSESTSWANEPVRRIRHSTVSTISGKVYIFGGEKADDSGEAFSEHYVFDPSVPSFTQISSTNGPPDITGHSSIILTNGTVLVFGGYHESASTLVPLSTIWTLDTTQDDLSWITLTLSTTSPPTPRRAFASVLIDDSKIFIQGGCDASFENTYSDGWVLDTSSLAWSQVDALSQIGARHDHFAAPYGEQIIFGFGYSTSGPVTEDLIQVYDSSSGSITDTFTPPSSSSLPTATIPRATQTGSESGSGSSGSRGGTGTGTSIHPTSTSGSGGGDSNDGGGDGSGSSPQDTDGNTTNQKTTAIAVGSALGVLALIAGVVVIVWYVHRRRQGGRSVEGRFMALGVDDNDNDGENPSSAHPIPLAGARNEKFTTSSRNILRNLGIAGPFASTKITKPVPERRDMLADEDTRDFGPWYDRRRRDGTGGSSWSLISMLRRPAREGSSSTVPKEKDPFSDGAPLMNDQETGYIGTATRPRNLREASHGTSASGYSYNDPFEDAILEDALDRRYNASDDGHDTANLRLVQPPSSLHVDTVLPLYNAPHLLSPVTEATSRNTLSSSDASSHAHSMELGLSPFDAMSSGVTSRTSYEKSPISLINQPTQPMRRSDSWWARFSRTSLLDRRSSGSRYSAPLEFHDPNPPPRLLAIEESQHSCSPEHDPSPDAQRSNSLQRGQATLARIGSKLYGGHGKSMTSIRTADSDAVNQIGGSMVVAQRERTGSSNTRESMSTGLSIDTDETHGRDSSSWIEDDRSEEPIGSPIAMSPKDGEDLPIPLVPVQALSKFSDKALTPPKISPTNSSTFSGSTGDSRPIRPLSGGTVAARIREFERRMSLDSEQPLPTNTKQREERSKKPLIDYGLVPRPSLFVANPDHRHGTSTSTDT